MTENQMRITKQHIKESIKKKMKENEGPINMTEKEMEYVGQGHLDFTARVSENAVEWLRNQNEEDRYIPFRDYFQPYTHYGS